MENLSLRWRLCWVGEWVHMALPRTLVVLPLRVLWNSYVEHCSALYRGTCGTCGQSSYQQRIVILYVFVRWESSYNSFFPIVWYHLHPVNRQYRRILSSVGSIAWSLGQDRGTDAQILWALLPGISPTKCCFFSKQSGSSCRQARGQCHSLESRLPVLSPLALLFILMAITAPFLSFPVSSDYICKRS